MTFSYLPIPLTLHLNYFFTLYLTYSPSSVPYLFSSLCTYPQVLLAADRSDMTPWEMNREIDFEQTGTDLSPISTLSIKITIILNRYR